MKKYAQFQFDYISSSAVIKDLKTQKNAIVFVNHVSQKVLTSATRGHVTLKFGTNVGRQILVTRAEFQVKTLRRS